MHEDNHQSSEGPNQLQSDHNSYSDNTALNAALGNLGELTKMVRMHDNVIKNLRQDVNQLNNKSEKQDKINNDVDKEV